MGAFTVIPQDTFQKLQLDAGVLLTTFDPATPAVTDANKRSFDSGCALARDDNAA